ncbi:MAG: protein-export chaperone SecB [Paracoccaceae bacterium]|nr:protein-export chaperone SecB [Paracoccaceae bacterium]
MSTEYSGKTNGAGRTAGEKTPAVAESESSDSATTPSPADASKAPRFEVMTQYIRDLSFENLAAQNYVSAEVRPDLSVEVKVDARTRAKDRYEVILNLSVSAKADDQAIFLLELDYGGQFLIENIPDEQLHPLLMVECPRILFPFIRRLARDLTAESGFPPLNIETIDFLRLYRQQLAESSA